MPKMLLKLLKIPTIMPLTREH